MVDELRIETERPLAVSHAAPDSLRQWLADLASLRRIAQALYGDVAWSSLKNGDIIQAHKFVLYARAPGQSHYGRICSEKHAQLILQFAFRRFPAPLHRGCPTSS